MISPFTGFAAPRRVSLISSRIWCQIAAKTSRNKTSRNKTRMTSAFQPTKVSRFERFGASLRWRRVIETPEKIDISTKEKCSENSAERFRDSEFSICRLHCFCIPSEFEALHSYQHDVKNVIEINSTHLPRKTLRTLRPEMCVLRPPSPCKYLALPVRLARVWSVDRTTGCCISSGSA